MTILKVIYSFQLFSGTRGMSELLRESQSGRNILINYAYKSINSFQLSSLCKLRQQGKTTFCMSISQSALFCM